MSALPWREQRPTTPADHAAIAAAARESIRAHWQHTPRHTKRVAS